VQASESSYHSLKPESGAADQLGWAGSFRGAIADKHLQAHKFIEKMKRSALKK
jgi:hypothetical protein